MTQLTEQPAYFALQSHFNEIAGQHMSEHFAKDSGRFSAFSLQFEEILLDYSKNLITSDTLKLLVNLANESHLSEKIVALFSGEKVNTTENRAALHTALREKTASNEVSIALSQMRDFCEKIRNQEWLGATGKPITNIVNIGIGGSHLGPVLVTQALKQFSDPNMRCFFISNIDEQHIQGVLSEINPETTLFIISSKSFTTIETITNAKIIYNWMQQHLGENIKTHFVAVTANSKQAIQFGIPKEQIFTFWDWVGGRYSIWSAIGLPIALMIGMENFIAFLEGAHAMDMHFRKAPFEKNLPVILGLLGIWYINFFNASQHAIIPYAHELDALPDYIQQLDMESNGKRIRHDGREIPYTTGPVIIGKQGCNGQHSFFQLLHQGQQMIPVDFILIGQNKQDMLIASALAQAQALMQGKNTQQAFAELIASGYDAEKAKNLAAHKSIPGNRPSNILFLNRLTPYNLGSLLALYEHKIYVQGVIWGINSFDQWGVELGKELLSQLLQNMQQDDMIEKHDASTNGLIKHYKKIKGNGV